VNISKQAMDQEELQVSSDFKYFQELKVNAIQ